LGIDYCCGGETLLGEACARRGLTIDAVLRALEDSDHAYSTAEQIDWTEESLTRLTDHIVTRHHTYLRDVLPGLGNLMENILAKHPEAYPGLTALRDMYVAMWDELCGHMMKEEVVLFPFIRAMESAERSDGVSANEFPCGSVLAPIHVMQEEHREAADSLSEMRKLTDGFRSPRDACNSYRVLMAGLREMEADLHLHIHLENNILFPRAVRLETSLRQPIAAQHSQRAAQHCAAFGGGP
ncbi:MAG TPA: iron-sulfur cluster repair di-iron protein, partial [Lacipirellulaceae bacterium]|nr:iron-sulfur cluster repair di-iron protein [Lacipirellulaceae bacterium]